MKQWQKADSKECKYFARKWGSGGGAFNSQTEKRIWDFESSRDCCRCNWSCCFPGFPWVFLLLLLLLLLLWSSCRYALTKLRCLRPAANPPTHCHAPF